MPMQASHILEINRPVADVFAFVNNPDNHPKWLEGVLETRELVKTPGRVGSTFEQDIKEGRSVSTYLGEVTGWRENALLEIKAVGWGCGKKPDTSRPPKMICFARYEFEQGTNPGTCRLTITTRAECGGGVMKFMMVLLGPLFRVMIRKMLKKFGGNLKRIMENGA
jgi:hypothetical protein